jgi:hypothetical protein
MYLDVSSPINVFGYDVRQHIQLGVFLLAFKTVFGVAGVDAAIIASVPGTRVTRQRDKERAAKTTKLYCFTDWEEKRGGLGFRV